MTNDEWEKALLAARLAGASNYIGRIAQDSHGYSYFCFLEKRREYSVLLMSVPQWVERAVRRGYHDIVLTAYLLGWRPGLYWDEESRQWIE